MAEAPLYQQVKQALLADIAAGRYSADRPFVTQRGICERFGVSHATAVRALNDLAAEGHLVRRRGMGTFVADHSESGKDSSTRTVACVLQGHGPHVSQLLAGIEGVCAEFGHRLFLRHCEDDPVREEQALRWALAQGVDGIIIYPAEGAGSTSAYAEVRRHGVPLVMVDRYRPDLPHDAVLADNFAAGELLTDALVAAGHRVIGTLWDEVDVTSVRDRLAGHLHSLRRHGIVMRPDLTVLRGYRTRPAKVRQQSLGQLLTGPHPPTVFLCANGYVLAEAAQDLIALGYGIPGEVDLAGMDDAGPFDVLPLTAAAVVLPSREMGEHALRLLHERITGAGEGPEQVVLPITVRTRQSAPAHLRVVGAREAPRT